MTGAVPVSPSSARTTAPQPQVSATLAFGRICQSLCNSLATLSSNHQLPGSAPEALRQGMSNASHFFNALIHASASGMERPLLAAGHLVLHWLFCQLRQQAMHQASSQLPRLMLTTAENPELNDYFYALNRLALSVSTAQQASAALACLKRDAVSREPWLNRLAAEDRNRCRDFEQKLTACLEKMAFWQPRSTLLLPLVNGLAPYLSVGIDLLIPPLAPAPAPPAPGQTLFASPVFPGETGPDAEGWFDPISLVLNLPAEVDRPPLNLRQGQSVCLRIAKCPSGIVQASGNQSAGFDMAGFGIEANLATRLCVSNHHQPAISIQRGLNRAASPYPSQIYRHPLQIAGANEVANHAVCPEPPVVTGAAARAGPEVLPHPAALRAASSGWHLLPLVGAQDIDMPQDNGEDLDPFGPMVGFDEWPFYDYDETSPPAVSPSASVASAEQIDYEVNLFSRDKRPFFPFQFTAQARTTATPRRTTLAPPATTPDSMSVLFGGADESTTVGSCRIKQPSPDVRDLADMLDKAQQWIAQLQAGKADSKIHAFFLQLTGNANSPRTPLEEVVTLARKLVTGNPPPYAIDENAARQFAALLFAGSGFQENRELLDAWVRSSEGRKQLTDILLFGIDRAIPDAGKLVSASMNSLLERMKPDITRFSALANILTDLQNGFRNNLIASVLNTGGTPPAFITNEIVIEKLQFLHRQFIEHHLPCFRLCEQQAVSDEIVLSENGVLLTMAAGMIADNDRLQTITPKTLKQFGLQAILRLSEDQVLSMFSYYDDLLAKGHFRMIDVLNNLQIKGELLVRTLYLNNKIYHGLQQGAEQLWQLNTDYQALAQVEKQLCILALGQMPAVDQDFFLHASREPQGLEVMFIRAGNASDPIKNPHFIGFNLAGEFDGIIRCYFFSVIPALNNLAAPIAFNDSDIYRNKEHYTRWINQAGKADFVARLSAQAPGELSQIRFFASDKQGLPQASVRENWRIYSQSLSQGITRLRFPEVRPLPSAAPAAGGLDNAVSFAGNLLYQLSPIESCKQAVSDIFDRPETLKKILISLEQSALCLYDISPEGEGSKLIKFISYGLRSVVGKITEKFREESQRASSAENQNPNEAQWLAEKRYIEDSQVKNHLANSTLFSAEFGWMLHNNSLNMRQLPSQVKIIEVFWDITTDQIYCKTNSTAGIKKYRFDQQNFLLLPSNHLRSPQALTINTRRFLDNIEGGTLDELKLDRLEEDIKVTKKYSPVYFKREFTPIDFNTANITATFFDNLIAPVGWQPQRLWVKKEDGDEIITEWKDSNNQIHFHQLSKYLEIFQEWHGEVDNNNGHATRAKRDISTAAPLFTDLVSPLQYGYTALNPFEDHQRQITLQRLVEKGNLLPDPPHFAEIACRKMMKELRHILPLDFIRGKYPAASNFIEKFASWETAALINDGFNKFVKAVELFHSENPDEESFYQKATHFIIHLRDLDKKKKAFNYLNRDWKEELDLYYNDYLAREMQVNRRLNKIIDKVRYPGTKDDSNYILKTRTTQDMATKYPQFLALLNLNLQEIHTQAERISNLFNNNHYPGLMKEVLHEFTLKLFTDAEAESFTADFRRLQNNLLALTPDRFRIFEERVSKDGKLVSGCFKNKEEKNLFGNGEIAFTMIADGHKHIYLQEISNSDLIKQLFTHEAGHINNGLDIAYTPPEVYVDSNNLMKKFSFRGIELFGKDLLSDRDHMVDYLMRDSQFLERFCDQLGKFAEKAEQRVKIIHFINTYLGKNTQRYQYRFSTSAEKKRADLRSLMDIAYNNNPFLLYFLKQNADFMISIWHRVAELAREYLEPNQKIDPDALIKFDRLKSLVLKAGALLLDEVNDGASTSNSTASAVG